MNREIIRLHKYVGLAGVAKNESKPARIADKIFERLTIFLIVILAVQWEMIRKGQMTPALDDGLNIVVWLFFIIETTLITFLVKKKWRYLRANWLNLLVVIAGIAVLIEYHPLSDYLEYLRPVLMVWLLAPWLDDCFASLSDNRLTTTLLTALLIVILSGTIMAGIDPAISSPLDGIWWAWVTMSTVGYGDVVPMSGLGRVFAAFLILMGLGFFAVITANFSAIFVQRGMKPTIKEVKKESAELRDILVGLESVKHDEEAIAKVLLNIQKRLDTLEAQIADKK